MEWLSAFHFLRPWALLLVPTFVLLVFFAQRQLQQSSAWKQWVEPTLLKQLLISENSNQWQLPWWLISLPLLCGAIGLAGPSWERIPQPVIQKKNALVIVLDLSPSMNSEDIKPSRLAISRFKLIDLLKLRNEGQTGLVVYAGEAHIVTPLTDDAQTLINLLPVLKPSLMPIRGSNVEAGIAQAIQLLKDSTLYEGDILLLSDGIAENALDDIHEQLASTAYKLSVMAVGTADGGPIPSGQGFMKDAQGNIVIAKTNLKALKSLADDNRGRFVTLQAGEQDLNSLVNFWQQTLSLNPLEGIGSENNDREFDQWQDSGHWFALLLILLFPLAFRRGGLFGFITALSLVTMASLTPSQQVMAQVSEEPPLTNLKQHKASDSPSPQTAAPLEQPLATTAEEPSSLGRAWQGLWKTPNQQGLEAFKEQDFKRAETLFEDPQWQATAKYQSGNYEGAAKAFSQGQSTSDLYNLGNALAQSGDLDKALKAYDQALKLDPTHENAKHNKALVEKLKQEQENQNQQQSSDDKDEQDQSDSDESEQDQKDQNQDKDSSADEQQDQSESTDNSDNKDEQEKEESKDQEPKEEENESQKKEQEKPAKDEQASDTEENESQQNQANASEDDLSDEERQALEQWLKQVPDDPSGLLRRKFQYQQRQKQIAYRNGQLSLPKNEAHKRY